MKPTSLINSAPRANEISADLDVSNIVDGKCTRKSKFGTSAAVYLEPDEDFGVDSGQPFFSCLASAITTDRLAKKLHRFNDDGNPIENFMMAAYEEFEGLHDRRAWDVLDINDVPENAQIFLMRWAFVTKRDSDGNLIKHKARTVVRGDLDKTPYNRDEIYSHTLALQHFRSLMSYINHEDLETLSSDAIQAFVNAKRDHPIYCSMPEGFRQRGKVLRVYQALYGHRQSPKDWFKCYTNALKSLNFTSMEE
ncbi:hypothetical protein K3495_g2084 [Podosphaera aphanis]|nr:hypothetical protein K3495_g2084 [Podosphaera aphanis]